MEINLVPEGSEQEGGYFPCFKKNVILLSGKQISQFTDIFIYQNTKKWEEL